MYNYISYSIPDPWIDSDMSNWEINGSERDDEMFIPRHNAKVRIVKDVFLCSFKQKDYTYKNIYVKPYTNKLFYFLISVPQLSAICDIDKDSISSKFIKRTPLLGKIYEGLSVSEIYELTDSIIIIPGCLFVKVQARFEDFIFPKHKIIDNPECVKKYQLLSSLYREISKEYDAIYDSLQRYLEKIKEAKKEAKRIGCKKCIKGCQDWTCCFNCR